MDDADCEKRLEYWMQQVELLREELARVHLTLESQNKRLEKLETPDGWESA